MKAIILFATVLVLLSISSLVHSHSYLTAPLSRSNQKQSNTGCRGPNCLGPCDAPKSQAGRSVPILDIKRGQKITLEWPRNNHAGGFIRVAWAKTSESDSHAAFDAHVEVISCHERGGCRPDDSKNPNGGDSGPADGSSRACSLQVSVPAGLEDGQWTLQWSWFGGAFELGDYFSCVDYKVSGGDALGDFAKSPLFLGGDVTYPNQQKCKFFNTDRLHKCVNEPCNNPIFSRAVEQSGLPFLGNSPSPSSITSASVPIPTPTKVTTSRIIPAPTPTPVPVPVPNPTPVPVPIPPTPLPSSDTCTKGYSSISKVTAKIVSVDTWGSTFRLNIELKATSTVSNWGLQILYPSDAVNSQVEGVFNAGQLSCENQVPKYAFLKPASWAQTIHSGETLTIEVMAKNTNMNKDFIMSNTKLNVFAASQ